MSKTLLVEHREINEAYRGLSGQLKGRKDDYFALLYLMKKFNITLEEATSHICFGGNDCAVDAFYLYGAERALYLFQFRCSRDHLLFRESFERMLLVGINRIFGHALQEENQNPLISRLSTCISENQGAIDRVIIQLVFNGDPIRAEQSTVLNHLRESLESRKYIVDGFFGRQVDIIFQVASNSRTVGHAFLPSRAEYNLRFRESLSVKTPSNDLVMTLLPLGSLYRMYCDLGEKFFEKNIRCGLHDGKLTNSEINGSLKRILANEDPAEHFTFYHNGVTLTAQELKFDGNSLRMIEPRLLNGVQTVNTVKRFVENNRRQREKVQKLLDGIKVLARIVRSREDEFLRMVTISNNRQNPITPWNLRANDLIQLHLEERFKCELSIYYERKENSLENLSDEDLEEKKIVNRRTIGIRKLAQTLLALHGEVDKISALSEVFESEKWYRDTFRERYLEIDPKKLVLLYKVQYRLPAIIKEIQYLGYEKYEYIGKLRNLVWCLAIQGVLNDEKFFSHVQSFGSSLTVETNFNILLRSIASNKLRYILKDALSENTYRDYLREAKYSFLKTKTVYNECMKVAERQNGWKKLNL